jgi:UDP-N-acetylglucosamine diphosphorylase / glucose-1-phosphate thymidylyltransferase / UDP-N-acetylgalactosamine diphosphorylase / glucosamine-1-phosphate N-acetyltransferase / galactosamine-1-phosphate N-acetyltransferase
MKAVILAAGMGTRMQPLTLTISKGMIPVANRPIIEWTLESLEFCEKVLIVISRDQKDIVEYLKGNKKVEFVIQNKQRGTGDALLSCEKFLRGEKRFIALYGDDFYGKKAIESISKFDEMALSSFEAPDPQNYGVIEVKNGYVTELDEKPKKPKSNLVSVGLYLFDQGIFAALKKIKISPRGEYELTDGIKLLIKSGSKIKENKIKTWISMSYPWKMLDVNRHILDQKGSIIDKDVKIRPGVVIEDPVCIGSGSVIGPNCYLRKYSTIGKNCRVGQAVEVKNSIVMDNTYVSHLSYVGDTIVGRNCNVAAGTIFTNLRFDEKNIKVSVNGNRIDTGRKKLGAIVGDNVKFGASCTIMPGKRLWPNLFIPPCMKIDDDISKPLPIGRKKGD